MSLLTSSIDLDTITPPTINVSQFQDSHIQNLANLFLKAGDTVSPILLHKISPIAFEILEGHFEYYAAMKAQEIDDQFTAIRAYVVPPDLESTIIEQYQFLRSLSVPVAAPATQNLAENLAKNLDLAQMEQAIVNRLEKTLSTTIDRILQERLNSSLQVLTNQITQQLSAQILDLKQSLSSAPISQVLEVPTQPTTLAPESSPVKSKPTKASKPKAPTSKAKANSIDNNDPKALQVLNDLNTMNFADLQRNLAKSTKTNTKFARPIDEMRLQQPEQKFQSIQDVIANVAGLAEKTMQKIIDAW